MHSWVEVASNAFAAIFREAEQRSLLSSSSFCESKDDQMKPA
jgi:hypothetical protein